MAVLTDKHPTATHVTAKVSDVHLLILVQKVTQEGGKSRAPKRQGW
jgi:hypothetical protein